MVRMELSRILIRETDDTHIVELRETGVDEDEARVFPIVIGLTEAAAIERRLMGQEPPRPQTHELLANVIQELGYKLEEVVINDLRHDELGRGTFFARLHLRPADGGEQIDIDSRPSDAIALGAAHEVPIFVEDHVLEEVGRSAEQ
jgi:bifunctional DNase/RNase